MSENVAPVAASTTSASSGTNVPAQGNKSSAESTNDSFSQKSVVGNSQTQSATSPTQPEYREYKINGKLVRMTQKEADDYVSMSYAAQEKFREAAEIRKREELKQAEYKKNRIKAFLDHTQDLTPEQRREILEDYYAKQYIEPESLTAEQRQLKELQEYKRQKEEAEKEAQEKQRIEEENKLTHQQREYLQSQIIEAMDASGLPKSKFFIQRMAFYMRQNLLNGWEAPKEVIIRQVQNERKQIMSDLTEDSSAEQLINLFGESIINKIRKYDLERLRDSRQKLNQPFQGVGSSSQGNEKIDYSEVNRRLRDLRTGRFVTNS